MTANTSTSPQASTGASGPTAALTALTAPTATASPSASTTEAPPRFRRAVIVVKETYLDLVTALGDTHQLKEIAARKPGLESVQESHEQHERCIATVTEALTAAGIALDTIHRNSEGLAGHLAKISDDGNCDLVVTVGGDGTFLRASHDISGDIPAIAVNSAPITSFGHYCITDGLGFAAVLKRIMKGELKPSRLLRLSLSLDGQALPEPVLNEVLVAHKHPAGTSRYSLRAAGRVVQHKCSGLLIAAPAGSTGFLRSEGGTVLPITDRRYTFMERAPFLRIGETADLNRAVLDACEPLEIVSQMQDGRLFVDGEHIEYDFPRGAVLTVSAGANDLLAYIDPDCHAPFINA
ncbi:MAG: NAD(+)/NADH kinase [Cyanobacteria bacterium REEB67]|nr:NAD(+)/NADH kinase [Cyanobacteria bacterium REEB67]